MAKETKETSSSAFPGTGDRIYRTDITNGDKKSTGRSWHSQDEATERAESDYDDDDDD